MRLSWGLLCRCWRRCRMTRKLLIVLVNTDPRNPEELGAPFYHAAVAAAMDYEVDVICAATAGKLMRHGVAEQIRIKAGVTRRSMTGSRMRMPTAPVSGSARRIWICST